MDPPLLTPTVSAAGSADVSNPTVRAAGTADVRPNPSPTNICNQFLDETARCTAKILESRHGMCLKHMTCVMVDTNLSEQDMRRRCVYAPSSCICCNLIIESLNKSLPTEERCCNCQG